MGGSNFIQVWAVLPEYFEQFSMWGFPTPINWTVLTEHFEFCLNRIWFYRNKSLSLNRSTCKCVLTPDSSRVVHSLLLWWFAQQYLAAPRATLELYHWADATAKQIAEDNWQVSLKCHIWHYNNDRFVDITLKCHIWHYDNEISINVTLNWHLWHYNNVKNDSLTVKCQIWHVKSMIFLALRSGIMAIYQYHKRGYCLHLAAVSVKLCDNNKWSICFYFQTYTVITSDSNFIIIKIN